jgi:hypothetical protein
MASGQHPAIEAAALRHLPRAPQALRRGALLVGLPTDGLPSPRPIGVAARFAQNCTLSRKPHKISGFQKRMLVLLDGKSLGISFQNLRSKSPRKASAIRSLF